jgi:uncharacterized protein
LTVEEVQVAAAVPAGQVVRVKVVAVDIERQRIGLSLRLKDAPERGRDKRPDQRRAKRPNPGRGKDSGRRAPDATGSMADALRKAGFGQ